MHVRVRLFGKPEVIVSVESKLTKIDKLRKLLQEKFDVKPNLQRLLYGGKLLENGYTFYDYNIKLNDVIQLMVHAQTSPKKEKLEITTSENKDDGNEESELEYKDAVSMLYTVGDCIDMRDTEHGAWFEGKIVRIVRDPTTPHPDINSDNADRPNKENDPEVKQQPVNGDKPKSGIEMFFCKTPKQPQSSQKNGKQKTEDQLMYKVQIQIGSNDDNNIYCKLKDIRPRARKLVTVEDLKIGQKVMLNHNTDYLHETGYWYDFKVCKIMQKRNIQELIGTIYLGPDSIPQNDTKVRLRDKMFAIEEVIPLKDRTEEYNELMKTEPEKRSQPLFCLKCRDDENVPCVECSCSVCAGKEFPEKIMLCDECHKGYHMECLDPPLTELPPGDWYCKLCKRDPNEVVAPGGAKQKKRQITTNRDWGRGMACVGKTKTCSMPPNHFGPIPGIEVGMCWRFRIQLSESGVHRPPVSGIHGRDGDGAYSIVLSGGYEDDVDNGNEFTYTGSGGRDLSGNKRTAEQSCDQKLTRENKALARNCAVKRVNEEGDDAGDDWRKGKPVRVVRSCKMLKHFPKYAPSEGIRYDGIYKVVKYYPEIGKSGFRVWKYLLRRDDPSPAPWEPGAKPFDIIYPDGYLEAEAEKKALKETNAKGPKGKGRQPKRALQETNAQLPVAKKRKESEGATASEPSAAKPKLETPNKKTLSSPKTPPNAIIIEMKSPIQIENSEAEPDGSKDLGKSILGDEVKATIAMDTLNAELWEECLDVCAQKGKKEFVEHVSTVFLCIICQEVIAGPVTTSCLHNFCMGCLKQAFKTTGSQACPYCRRNLSTQVPEPNDRLKAALRAILPGYDANRT